MRLSSKTITAIKLFIDLGEHYNGGFETLTDIASRKELSKKFLEQIIPLFRNSGLLIGSRGNQGGYKLSKSPKDITLKDIIYVTEPALGEYKTNNQTIDNILNEVDQKLNDTFCNITVEKLLEKELESYTNIYYI